MTPASFLPLLETELHARAVPFERRDVQAFVEAAWPLILDDPQPARWAGAFLEVCPAIPTPSPSPPAAP